MIQLLGLLCAALTAGAQASTGDVLARLALELKNPIAWAAMSGTAEGRALARRVLGRPLAEPADIDPFVRALEGVTDAQRVAEELHVRLFRLQREALWTRGGALDEGLGQVARRHLGIRSFVWNPVTDLRRIQFAEPLFEAAAREAFLEGGAAPLPADEALRRLARAIKRDWRVHYLLFNTPEGREFTDWVVGMRPWQRDASPSRLLELLGTPEHRGLALDLDLRIGLALEGATATHWTQTQIGLENALARQATSLLAVNWSAGELLVFRPLRTPVPRPAYGDRTRYFDP